MTTPRTPVPRSQKAALRQHYQTSDPKPTHAAMIAWFRSQFGYTISQSMVSRSLNTSFAYLDSRVTTNAGYRSRSCRWPRLETLLISWLEEVDDRSGQVSNNVIVLKAKQLWEQSDEFHALEMPKFSTGWAVKFRQRHNPRTRSFSDQSPDPTSPSQSSNRSADTTKPTSILISPQAANSITTTSEGSASSRLDNTKSVTLAFSSDHLIHLIQHTSYRALMSNKSLLLAASLVFEASSSTEPIKQFATKVCGGLTTIRPFIDRHIPDSLYPTQLQMNCAHTSIINMFPFPRFRDNLIRKGVDFVPEDLCRDLFGDIFPDYTSQLHGEDDCLSNMRNILSALPSSTENANSGVERFDDRDDYTAGRKCLISWGDPWRVENWEVTPGFIQKWDWALEGCDDLIQSSNRWRALRNESLIPWTSQTVNFTLKF